MQAVRFVIHLSDQASEKNTLKLNPEFGGVGRLKDVLLQHTVIMVIIVNYFNNGATFCG